MRILFDQGTPAPLRDHQPAHQVSTAYEMGWSTLQNGELLDQAETSGFEVLVTTDKNMSRQQTLVNRRISVLALSTTSWPRIRGCAQAVNRAVETTLPGVWRVVEIP